MPVDFLTREQERSYGRYNGEPSPAQLSRYFHLDDADRALIGPKRGAHNRLGFALQLGTVRFLGTFLSEPTDVPPVVVNYLCAQLGMTDSACLAHYNQGRARYAHVREIQQHYGYREFNDPLERFRLTRWLYVRAWLTAERASLLFDLATARLVARKVLLPGVTILARLVASVRDRAAARLWRVLAASPNARQKARLRALLLTPEGERQSPLERLRNGPTWASGPTVVEALERLNEIRAIGVGGLDLSHVPPGRLKNLARYAAVTWTANIARMPAERKIATLLAFAKAYEAIAMDDALDLLNLLIIEIVKDAKVAGEKNRMRTLGDLDAAALTMANACLVLVDNACASSRVRSTAFRRTPKRVLLNAINTAFELARTPDERFNGEELVDQYKRVRRFFPHLLATVQFQGTPAAKPLLRTLEFLAALEERRRPSMQGAPLELIQRPWRRLVLGEDGQVDRAAYTLCTLLHLQDALQRRDLFVSPSERWGDPRARLLQGPEWIAVKPHICKTLGLDPDPEKELRAQAEHLDEAYRIAAANIPANAAVRIEHKGGQDVLVLTGLDKLDEPPSLTDLREKVDALLPRVDLPEVILEIQLHTGFANEFTHISEGGSRAEELSLSICAVLLAEACNVGLEPLVQRDMPALTRGRLAWIQQNYMRAETITRSNARLVEAQTRIPTAHAWGGGEVASADGLRFVTPVRTVNSGPNSKYFGAGRGITYYNFTSDQFTGFHGIVTPGTLRDSMVLLAGLLEQQTCLNPQQVMTDTAGASDVVFGLFGLLGYQFSPRLADMKSTRFWRIDPMSDYGLLNELGRHRISTTLIARHWDDMLRVAGSLKLGKVSAFELMGSLLRSKRPSALARAIANFGRLHKTLHLLNYIDDESYRRQILVQLNRGEGRNGVARALCHGKRGEIRQAYREGQEDQLGILGLVTNVIVLWNTLYIDAALNHLRATGYEVRPEDVARLSPLGTKHIHFLGRYSFALADAVAQGRLRPLRDPSDPSQQDDWLP